MTEKAGINKRMRVPESEGKAEKRSGMKNAKSAPSVVTSLGLLIFLRFSPPPLTPPSTLKGGCSLVTSCALSLGK